MTEVLFNDRGKVPDDTGLARALGDSFQVWNEVRALARERVGETVEEWKFYGKKYGWQMKTLLKKRNLFFLIPRDSHFSIVFIFGDRAVDWPGIFADDETITAAILDRLLHHAHVLNVKGQSYRMKDFAQLH